MTDSCKTKYPFVLVHGMGFRDFKYINYWGRIPQMLTNMGASVHYGKQESNASIVNNAQLLKSSVEEVLHNTGAEKVNIIAHSKGGLEARYMLSSLDMKDKIASLTTLATPHNGSETVDFLMKFPDFIIKFGCKICDLVYRIMGDKNPDTYRAIDSFTTKSADKFNIENKDVLGVYYQSYAFVMSSCFSDIFMTIPNIVVKFFEGENDGLVSAKNAEWTNFKGVYGNNIRRGISHCDEVDMRRRPFTKKSCEGISDITIFYKEMVEELKNLGF